MISRYVHKHTPILQLERPEFKQFLLDNNLEKLDKNQIIDIDIDKIPAMY